MKILFDLNHPADVNFFKKSIEFLSESHNVKIIYRHRGVLKNIIDCELPGFEAVEIGKHKKYFFLKIISQLFREVFLVKYLLKNKIDLVLCFGGTSAFSSWFCRIPYLSFDDDIEYKIPFFYANIFCTKHIYPEFINFKNKKTVLYNGYKELAYLHPENINFNKKILRKLDVIENNYVFVREIDNVSLNYKSNKIDLSKVIESINNLGYKAIISIENKFKPNNLRGGNYQILTDQNSSYFNILYYAKFVVSSGDTVARESALLGTPTIYTGDRIMAANNFLINKKFITKIKNIEQFNKEIKSINDKTKKNNRTKIKSLIKKSFENTSDVIINNAKNYIK